MSQQRSRIIRGVGFQPAIETHAAPLGLDGFVGHRIHGFTHVAIVCRPSGTYAPDFLSPQAHDSLFLNQMLGEIGDLFTAYLFHNLLDLLLQHFENVMAAVLAER